MTTDAKGGLWVGGEPSGKGVYYYDPAAGWRGRKRPFRQAQTPDILQKGLSLAFHVDSQDTLWLGKFYDGL